MRKEIIMDKSPTKVDNRGELFLYYDTFKRVIAFVFLIATGTAIHPSRFSCLFLPEKGRKLYLASRTGQKQSLSGLASMNSAAWLEGRIMQRRNRILPNIVDNTTISKYRYCVSLPKKSLIVSSVTKI